jgi:hypothetical protein
MFGPKFAGLVALFVSLATAQTTTLEAESATLSGVTIATTVPGYSGEWAILGRIVDASVFLITKQDLDMSKASMREQTRSPSPSQQQSPNSSTSN